MYSPLAEQDVRTSGVVTGVLRRGFFLQTPDVKWDGKSSDAIFVYSSAWRPALGAELELNGEVIDYLKHATAKPVTQIHLDQARIKNTNGPTIEPIDITAELLPDSNSALATLLNSLEGMLLRIRKGNTFIAPSNKYGDYVVALDHPQADRSVLRTEHLGVIAGADNPLRWFPGFRITNYNHAPRLNVGAKLASDVIGPLNYRVDAYQMSVDQPLKVDQSFITTSMSSLLPEPGFVTIMTLNCFNLDPHIESPAKVMNPDQDVDDDWGEGRFHTLAQAVVLQANSPDIVALQEIQDNDGAEVTEVVDASKTYGLLIQTIEELSGIKYMWTDVKPEVGADGGQPGGNIRNGFLYNPQRVELSKGSVRSFGKKKECFVDSRKPLLATFKELTSGKKIACINLHLASKRHQSSIFDTENAGVDAKLGVRVMQSAVVHKQMQKLSKQGLPYYVTGDFNDTEYSQTLQAMLDNDAVNLVQTLTEDERYDYNHRGKLQVLMHGIVPRKMAEADRAEYQIIHGNELLGISPGEETNKPSDHAYVIAKLRLA